MNGSDLPSYGVLRQRALADELARHVEELEVLGFTVVPSTLDGAQLMKVRDGIEAARAHCESLSLPQLEADRDIVRCPLAFDDLFVEIATLAPVMTIAERLLGANLVLLQQNAILNRPAIPQHQSRWHRDLPYQHFVSSRKLALSALLCVDDFTPTTGGTVALPGSHMFEDFPSAALVEKIEQPIVAPAGSIIMMDAMLYHRAGANMSEKVRLGVNHLLGLPFLVQQIDIPRQLGGRFRDDPRLGPYLGYRWNPSPDVASWQSQRI